MGKSALFYSIVIAAAASFASIASAADYQGIRIFQSSEQFDEAVMADTVVMKLPQNLTLYRKKGSPEAKRTIESVLPMRGDNGKVEKELVVRCELSQFTHKTKLVLPSTAGTANPWKVFGVNRLNNSKETWTLGRDGSQRISMTCHSFERAGLFIHEVSLSATLVNRALSTVNGAVLTSVQPWELMLDSRPYNDVVTAPAPIQESNIRQ